MSGNSHAGCSTSLKFALAASVIAMVWIEPANAQESATPVRTWTSKDGKFSLEAKFVSFEDAVVKLNKNNGQGGIDVPVERLCFDDHKYIASVADWGRVWRNTTGKELYVAKFESVAGKRIRLHKMDGKRIHVSLSVLHPECRKVVVERTSGQAGGQQDWLPGASTIVDVPLDPAASDAAIRQLISDCELRSRKIVVDGLANDWQDLPVFYAGTKFSEGSLDIERVGIAPRESDLVVVIQTRNPPSRDDFSFYVRFDFLGQGLQDVQLALSATSPQAVKVYDEANSYKVLNETKLNGVVVRVRDVVEVQIPYATLRTVLPRPMGDVLSGERARPYVRVECFSFDRANRSIADHGPSVASYRFLRKQYQLDAEPPGDERNSIPVSVPFEGKWFLVNAAMGYSGHVGIHAYDFAIMDRQLQRAKVRGSTNNSDYYCFGRRILNPIEGVVSRTESNEPDGTPLEKIKKRSNKVVSNMRGRDGLQMLLYHFQQGKVDVSEGQELKRGEVVGLCGNSGTSRAAHLHMEVSAPKLQGKPATLPIALERAFVSLNPGPDDPWTRYVENWEIRGNVFVEAPRER